MIQAFNRQKGAAMITMVIFFIFGSLAVMFAIARPALQQIQSSQTRVQSVYANTLAESGSMDAYYRINSDMTIGSSETITLDGHSVITTITSPSGSERVITAVADVKNRIRKNNMTMGRGIKIPLTITVVTGADGIVMNQNSTITGEAYSNGIIQGSSGTTITKNASAVSSSAPIVDIINNIPPIPTTSVRVGDTASTEDIAQSIGFTNTNPFMKLQFYMKKIGNPGDRSVYIVEDNLGTPSTTVLASGVLYSRFVTNDYFWVDVTMSPNFTPNITDTYWIVIDGGVNSSNYYEIGTNPFTPLGKAQSGSYGESWVDVVPSGMDIGFATILGTLDGSITDIDSIGEDGHAHTITGSSLDTPASNNFYCQVEIGNNESCNTSRTNPGSLNNPLSSGNIQEFKDEAVAGGTILVPYTALVSSSLGPKKIEGDLTVKNGVTLTLTGTIWVTGDIILENNSIIKLDNSIYGGTGGVVVTDGQVDIKNNASLEGTGTTGSFLLLISTSSCDESNILTCGGANAIDVSNNTEGTILYAENGTVSFSNNVSTTAAYAKKLFMKNNSMVTVDGSVKDARFTGGSDSPWELDTWREIE